VAHLRLGPLLRHVDHESATVWVELEAPGEIEVLGHRARSFTVHGHHVALVDVLGLEPGSEQRYEVRVDGELAWPEPGDPFPPPVIRTLGHDGPLRLAFGSCRQSAPHDEAGERAWGIDALRTLAHRLRRGAAPPPDLALLLGDQVYADEPTEEMDDFIRARRDPDEPPGLELKDFEEYCELYRLAWTEPSIRWLLSTVPTAMVFDDHDVRDDWGTSQAWHERMDRTPWWRARIVGALGSYWVFQHLGNLSRAERAEDALLAALREHGGDGGALLDEHAARAYDDPDSVRWSYARELGATRLVVVDSRSARRLTPGDRAMLDRAEWAWLEDQLQGGPEHLLVASSVPVLLPDAVHHLQRWDEAVADGAWGPRAARMAERLRQAADLEHWAAFGASFEAMERLVADLAQGRRGPAPRSLTFLSGDVHFSYLARVAPLGETRVAQAVCSPVRNPLGRGIRAGNRLLRTRALRRAMRALARRAGVGPPAWSWGLTDGPWFDNAIATLEVDGAAARVTWETPCAGAEDLAVLGSAELA
jgi:hypothetical protein